MIGVRNPKKDDKYNQWQPDNGEEKCAEIWVNELRLTDFNERGGWATIGRLSANMAATKPHCQKAPVIRRRTMNNIRVLAI